MKKVTLLFVLTGILMIATHPYFSHWYISNQPLLYGLTFLPYPLLIYAFYLYAQLYNRYFKEESQERFHAIIDLQDDLKRMSEAIKYDYIFYEHFKDENFARLSSSINDILGYDIDFVKKNYHQLNMEVLVKDVFERNIESFRKGVQTPLYIIHLQSKMGEMVTFEVKEQLSIISANGYDKVCGVLKKQPRTDELIQQKETDLLSKYNHLYNLTSDAIIIMKSNKIVDCNTKTLELFETTLNHIFMYSPFSLQFSPEYQSSAFKSIEISAKRMLSAYEGQRQQFDWTFNTKNLELIDTKVNMERFSQGGEWFLMLSISKI